VVLVGKEERKSVTWTCPPPHPTPPPPKRKESLNKKSSMVFNKSYGNQLSSGVLLYFEGSGRKCYDFILQKVLSPV